MDWSPRYLHVLDFYRRFLLLAIPIVLLQTGWCSALTVRAEGGLSLAIKNSVGNPSDIKDISNGSNILVSSKRQTNAVISVNQPASCPPVNASASTTSINGPNGSIFFLNCGISWDNQYNGGWTPPLITMDQLAVNIDSSSASALNNTVLRACTPFYENFRNASDGYGVPLILLMAFAMQESACNPGATGAGGSAGLLQLSPDKCTYSNCYDASTNLNIGARYLRSLLDVDPNIVFAVGSWNGWYKGMTYSQVTSVRGTSCYSQQNLDYLQQYFNGWLQNIDAYGRLASGDRLGYFFNLDVCASGGTSGASVRIEMPVSWWIYLCSIFLLLI